MPHIAVMMYPGRDEETKKRLAEKIRQAVIDELKVPASVVSISAFDIEKDAFPKAMESIPKENIILK